ncbi:MAG: DnaK suppressor protein [Thermoleophilaceae bacterium]|jgi:DnaK suppressor protein|nr:DnaK suppressor protein [Thermoleophilaceae bacterium]
MPEREKELGLAAIEETLKAHRDAIQQRRSKLTKAPERGSGVSFGKRVGDGTTEAVSRLTDVGVVDSLNLSEERIERALAKLAEGSYGSCDRCGEPIPAARLAAAPESVYCVACARLVR